MMGRECEGGSVGERLRGRVGERWVGSVGKR